MSSYFSPLIVRVNSAFRALILGLYLQKMEKEEFKHLVRIANTDLDDNKPIYHALKKIKGVSFMFSNMICSLAKVDKLKKTGYLNDEEIKRIDGAVKDPSKLNGPVWMFNRRKDCETGVDKHIITTDLDFQQDNDVKIMKKIRSYKGIRHSFGLPVRGQRTKSNFRKNKGKVHLGVKVKSGSKPGRV